MRRPIETRVLHIPVIDPLGAAHDSAMPFLAEAINPVEVRRQFEDCRIFSKARDSWLQLSAIRVVRHTPGRRCLIEYDVQVGNAGAPPEALTLIGKAQANGLDRASYNLQRALWQAGFDAESADGIGVPEPIGVIPAFYMWLQRKVPGVTAAELLVKPGGPALAGRMAEVAYKLHRAGVTPFRSHTIADELRALHERLALVAHEHPGWAGSIKRILYGCVRLGRMIPATSPRGIHRDFYANRIVVDGPRLYLLDLDRYCAGDPALDIGNCAGHLIEQGLRAQGDPGALLDRVAALEARYTALAGHATHPAIHAYTTLSLARHISISHHIAERRPYTSALIEFCERRLIANLL
jgi:hypothetical protein